MGSGIKNICAFGIAGLLLFASAGFAQKYQMELTGVGDGASADGAYVGPYQGTISENGTQIYAGYVICDDFNTNSYLDTPWTATATHAGSLNGNEKFKGTYTDPNGDGTLWNPGQVFTAQQNYDAVAWLASQLLLASNVTNATAQINYSFAIWNIFDGQTTDPNGKGAVANLIGQAFAAVLGGYQANNVSVFTPTPFLNASQEFLVVGANTNVATPEPGAALFLAFDLLSALAIAFLLRRYWVRA